MGSNGGYRSGLMTRLGRRGMSTTSAAVIMIVVILIVGGAGYAGLSAAGTSGGTTNKQVTSCYPPDSPGCVAKAVNDVTLFTPYRPGLNQQIVSLTQGQSIPITVGVSGGETVTSYAVNWGDGVTNSSKVPTLTHVYNVLGTYLISGTALVSGLTHTGYGSLIAVQVGPSLGTTSSGEYPTLSTTLTNGSGASGSNFGWIQAGAGPVTVSAAVSAPPTDATWTTLSPSIVVPTGSGVSCTATNTTNSASATCSFSASSIYTLTYTGPETNVVTGATAVQNFTWTIVVSPTGIAPACAACKGLPPGTSPHPGVIDAYEVAAGGGTTTDASVQYDSVSGEVLSNIQETLITYNGTAIGSSASNFVPELATCVPGSPQCGTMYPGAPGTDLVVNNATTNLPEYYTFVIDPNAHFYDPMTSTGWGVYPSDIMFSSARYMAYADNPSYPGWILSQALLPNDANGSWDLFSGYPLHAVPYGSNANNTAPNIMGSMLINDTTYCPQAAITNAHGCITYNAWGGGHAWAFFLQLIASNWGNTIVPCGWYSYEGAKLPGWAGTSLAKGDGPCLLPGNASSTSSTAFQTYLSGLTPTSWDTLSQTSLTAPVYTPVPGVATQSVGSGPYYLVPGSWNPSVGYNLKANPDYQGPTCAGQTGCFPAAGSYAATVNVFWEPDDTIPIQEYLAGQADFAGYSAPETGQILQLAKNGQIGFGTGPTYIIDQIQENLYFNATTLKTILPSTGFNVPADFFSQVGLRQFLAHAFPYANYINNIETVDGIAYVEPSGGVIPRGMGNLYPQNVTWPYGDPITDSSVRGGAAWWWAQINDPTSPFYDSELSSCSSSSPCVFPIMGQQGATGLHNGLLAFSSAINSISGGALKSYVYDITFSQAVTYSGLGPGQNPLSFFRLGWAPDYPDPSDYVGPYLYPDSIYTYSNALNETLSGTYASTGNPYNSTSCGHWNDPGYWSAYVEANLSIPENCQWTAYNAMLTALNAAAHDVGPQRQLDFNMAEQILNGMALMIYMDQRVGTWTYANWINPASLDTNIVTGMATQLEFFVVQGNGVV